MVSGNEHRQVSRFSNFKHQDLTVEQLRASNDSTPKIMNLTINTGAQKGFRQGNTTSYEQKFVTLDKTAASSTTPTHLPYKQHVYKMDKNYYNPSSVGTTNMHARTVRNFNERKHNVSEHKIDGVQTTARMQATQNILTPKVQGATIDKYAIATTTKGFVQFPDQTHNMLLQTQTSFGNEKRGFKA